MLQGIWKRGLFERASRCAFGKLVLSEYSSLDPLNAQKFLIYIFSFFRRTTDGSNATGVEHHLKGKKIWIYIKWVTRVSETLLGETSSLEKVKSNAISSVLAIQRKTSEQHSPVQYKKQEKKVIEQRMTSLLPHFLFLLLLKKNTFTLQ